MGNTSNTGAIIKWAEDVQKQPDKALKTGGIILAVGGILYGGKKAIDGISSFFKNRRAKKQEKEKTEELVKREKAKTEESIKREKARTEEIMKRASVKKTSKVELTLSRQEEDLPRDAAKSVKELPKADNSSRVTLVPNLIRSDQNTIIYGDTKIGKTFLGVQLASDLAQGGSSSLFPDEHINVMPHSVVYYNYEQDSEDILENFKELPYSLPGLYMIDQSVCGSKINNLTLLMNDIRLRIDSFHPGTAIAIFLDNLNRIVDNANAKREVNQLIGKLEELRIYAKQKDCSLSVIILAHTNKEGAFQGASALLEKAKAIIHFEKINDDLRRLRLIKTNNNNFKTELYYILKWTKDPKYDVSRFVLDHVENDDDGVIIESSHKRNLKKKDVRCKLTKEEIEDIIKRKNAGERIEDLANEKGTSMKTIYKWINKYSEEHKE